MSSKDINKIKEFVISLKDVLLALWDDDISHLDALKAIEKYKKDKEAGLI